MANVELVDTNADNISEFSICTYKNPKLDGYQRKMEWLKERYKDGLRFKVLQSDEDGTIGTIEYLPGEHTWRAVEGAEGYMFVHCLFLVPKAYKGKGYGSLMLENCLAEASKEKMHGVVSVTRKGSFMASKDIFCKHGFEVVGEAPPDFQLVVRKFKKKAASPGFPEDWDKRLRKYQDGLTILRSDQCPGIAKPFSEICETAREEYGIEPNIIEVTNSGQSRKAPSAYGGVLTIIYNGKLLSDHCISNTRFKNMMNKIL